MDVLWDHGPMTVRGVIEHLPNDPAYTTIATVLGNLHRKGLVVPHKEGHSTRYAARIGREEQAASVMRHALASSRDPAASMLHFVDGMSESDLAILREYLDQRDGGRRT